MHPKIYIFISNHKFNKKKKFICYIPRNYQALIRHDWCYPVVIFPTEIYKKKF